MDSVINADASPRLLIVDDNMVVRNMLVTILHKLDFELQLAADGDEALNITSEFEPDLILMDIIMPGLDGREVVERIRKMNLARRPAIIMISSLSDNTVIADALARGADDFVIKPFKEEELLARIDAQLRIRHFYVDVERNRRDLEIILDITKTVSSSLDSEKVLGIAVCKLAEVTGATRCSILLVGEEDVGYVLASHDSPDVTNLKVDLSKYPEVKEAIRTKAMLVVDDMGSDPMMADIHDMLDGLGFDGMSVIVVPIVFGEDVLGTLFLRANKHGQGFGEKEIALCRVVANATYPAIRNARLFEDTVAEKEAVLEEKIYDLNESQARLTHTNEILSREIDVRIQAEESLTASLLEKEVLLKEIHHRVKNNLQVISGLLRLQAIALESMPDVDISQVLEDCQNRIKSMAIIHDRIHLERDLVNVNFCDCLKVVASDLMDSYALGSATKLNWDGSDLSLTLNQAIPCSLVVNELISNSMKHAFKESIAGEITISLKELGEQMVEMKIGDNGVGFAGGVNWKDTKTMGLDLVRGLVAQIGGTIELDSSIGTEYTIRFRREA